MPGSKTSQIARRSPASKTPTTHKRSAKRIHSRPSGSARLRRTALRFSRTPRRWPALAAQRQARCGECSACCNQKILSRSALRCGTDLSKGKTKLTQITPGLKACFVPDGPKTGGLWVRGNNLASSAARRSSSLTLDGGWVVLDQSKATLAGASLARKLAEIVALRLLSFRVRRKPDSCPRSGLDRASRCKRRAVATHGVRRPARPPRGVGARLQGGRLIASVQAQAHALDCIGLRGNALAPAAASSISPIIPDPARGCRS